MKVIDTEGKVYEGTPFEIVSKMRGIYNRFNPNPAANNEDLILKYVEFSRGLGSPIIVSGATKEEKCDSFIKSLLANGQLKEV